MGIAIVSFFAGVLIDLDHLFDYYANHEFTLKAMKIYRACLEVNLNKIYILLHSYELIALLWVLIYTLSLSSIWKAVAIGLTQHIIFDQMTNPFNRLGYLLTYRISRSFKKELLLRKIKRF